MRRIRWATGQTFFPLIESRAAKKRLCRRITLHDREVSYYICLFPAARPPSQKEQARTQHQPKSAHGALFENDGAIEDNEEKEAMPNHHQAFGAMQVTGQALPPPAAHVQYPCRGEGITHKQSAAPIPAQSFRGLARGIAKRRGMAPAMIELKGAINVR